MRICGMASSLISTFCPTVMSSAQKVYECVRDDRFWRGWALALVAEAVPHPLASSLLLTAAALQMHDCLPSIDAERKILCDFSEKLERAATVTELRQLREQLNPLQGRLSSVRKSLATLDEEIKQDIFPQVLKLQFEIFRVSATWEYQKLTARYLFPFTVFSLSSVYEFCVWKLGEF